MPIWVAAVLLLAALKVGFGVAAFFVGTPVSPTPGGLPPVPPTLSLLHMAVYSVVGGMLVLNGHRDRRALALGGAFIGLAAAGSDRLFIHLTEGPDWVSTAVGYLSHLHPDAFLPLFIWLFFRDFPRAPTTPMWQKITQAGIGLTAAAGTLLFALHAAPLITPQTTSSVTSSVLLLFQPSSNLYLYTWVTVIGLTLPAFVLAIWKIRSAPDQERRRVGLLLAGLLIGSSPMLLGILLGALIPAVRGWMDDPSHRWLNHYVFRPFLMVIPVTTAYSVLVQHALDVKLVARRAIRYALARYAVLAGTAIPFAGLVLYLYQHRQETLTELLSGLRPLLLIAATAFGLVVFRLRRKVLHLIDRRFFREHYDSHQILLSLVEGSRRTSSPDELAGLLSAEIDRALHLETISVFKLTKSTGELEDDGERRIPSLGIASSLVHLVGAQTQPLEVDFANPDSPIHRLPVEERNWLARTGFRLLVPLIGSQGSLVGLIALGRKKSELPFSGEDQLLLSTIAASAALGLESRLIAASPEADWPTPPQRQPDRGAPFTQSTPGDERAVECQVCHRIEPPSREHCSACDGALEPTGLPYVLLGKFRFEQRIGKGGMGVVYRAVDLALGRTVAIKTLPKISPVFAARLRQEARAMASVVHPNLALIYGVETWRQTPLLVVELLEGGTLADRLNKQALDLQEAIELGMTLAQVLEKMHAVGMLHRDIKPSNVGYTADGSPKLLDLGLAKILDDSRRMGFPVEGSTLDELDSLPNSKLTSLTVTRRVVGTPIYLSPEAARGDGPSPSFDLWSLSVVLFEAITGHHPLSIDQMLGLRERILRGDVDDIRGHLPVCPTALALFFDDALSAEPSRRPATAGDFIARLEAMQDLL